GASRNFAIAHGGVTVTEIEQRARNIHREIQRVAGGNLRSVHVAAKFRGHDGAASFAVRRGNANAAKKRMYGKAHFEIRIERLKRGGVFLLVDGIEPHTLG